LTSTGGEPPYLNHIKYYIVASVLFQFPFNLFASVYPSIPTHGQPAIFPFTLHFELIVYAIPLVLSFGICVCLLFCVVVYIQGFCSFSLSLSLSLSLSRSSCQLTSLSRPGLRSFQDACSRPSRQILNWARNHQKASLAQWLERWPYEP
jgi:hypothetical protein